jgi:hypothetical protein
MKIFKRLCYLALILLVSVHFSNCSSSSESKPKKQVVSFADVWFSDGVDNDKDGYYSYLHLNFDLNVSSGSTDLFVQIYWRYTDPLDTAGYWNYMESAVFTISGSTDGDAKYVSIGSPNDELPERSYDFMIWVYKESDPDNPILELASYNDDNFGDVLTGIPIEEDITDAALTIYDAYWDNVVDTDEDGYATQADLVVDVDVTRGVKTYAYLVIYQKSYNSSTYSLRAVTENFTVTGANSADAVAVLIDSLSYGLYDFKIDVYYDVGSNIEDTDDASTNPDLNDVAFELVGAWLWYDDGYLEDALSSDLPSYFAVRFDKPSGAVTCSVKEIYLYVTSRDTTISYANFKIWDNSASNLPSSYLYDGTTNIYIAYDENNYYSAQGTMNVDVSAGDAFWVGYYMIYGYGFYLGADTSSPHYRSYFRNSSTINWRMNLLDDFCIRVYVEYTTGKNKNSLVSHGEWIDVSVKN